MRHDAKTAPDEEVSMDVVEWLSLEILPHEAEARTFIRAAALNPAEEDDIVQEVYCRLLEIGSAARPRDGRGLLLQTVQDAIQDYLHQSTVVRIDISSIVQSVAAPEAINSPEFIAHDRRLLAEVREAMTALPHRCREVFELRKLWGLTQKDVSRRLNLSEKTVEKETTRGLRLIMLAMADRTPSPRTRRINGAIPLPRRDRRGGRRMGGQGRRSPFKLD